LRNAVDKQHEPVTSYSGQFSFLEKPFTPDSVLAKIRSALD
jgi:hypothetical protein